MNTDKAKLLAHELTMKYIEINRNVLNDTVLSNIPKMVDTFADINKRFYEAVLHHKVLDELY